MDFNGACKLCFNAIYTLLVVYFKFKQTLQSILQQSLEVLVMAKK